jgi:hypothetical protein
MSFSIEYMRMCESNDYWERRVPGSNGSVWTVKFDRFDHKSTDVEHDFSCDCPSYKFGKAPYCKHILAVQKEFCGWHQQYSDEALKPGSTKCPKCGGPTVVIRVGV